MTIKGFKFFATKNDFLKYADKLEGNIVNSEGKFPDYEETPCIPKKFPCFVKTNREIHMTQP